jgi:hypothetical protein
MVDELPSLIGQAEFYGRLNGVRGDVRYKTTRKKEVVVETFYYLLDTHQPLKNWGFTLDLYGFCLLLPWIINSQIVQLLVDL